MNKIPRAEFIPHHQSNICFSCIKHCIDCGKLTKGFGLRCYSCAIRKNNTKHGKYSKGFNNYCINCGKKISPFSKRCGKCNARQLYKERKILPNRKIGRNFPKCQNCNRQLLSYNSKLCKKCYLSKKNNPLFRHGKTSQQYYCIDCGKKINWRSIRCKSCANKGRFNNHFGKKSHGKWQKYKRDWMRSSYEIAFAKWCDKNNIKWFYEPKTFNLGNTTYTPDFYLPERNLFIEIKGWWRDDAKKKFKLFKKKYPKINIKILNKERLILLGILDYKKSYCSVCKNTGVWIEFFYYLIYTDKNGKQIAFGVDSIK